jgi:hypothetical protein
MAATRAKTGFGTRIYRGDGASPTETFVAIAEIGDVSGPELRLQTEDATHMESPNGYVEKIPTIREAGDVTFDMHLIEGEITQSPLFDDLNESALRNFRLVFPSGGTRIAFKAYVTSIGPSFPVKGKMVRSVTLSITGKPVEEPNS